MTLIARRTYFRVAPAGRLGNDRRLRLSNALVEPGNAGPGRHGPAVEKVLLHMIDEALLVFRVRHQVLVQVLRVAMPVAALIAVVEWSCAIDRVGTVRS